MNDKEKQAVEEIIFGIKNLTNNAIYNITQVNNNVDTTYSKICLVLNISEESIQQLVDLSEGKYK